MLSLMTSFGRKLDPRGYTPLDLALRNKHNDTVMQLIRFDPELIKVRSRGRKTPLHYVAETNNADLLSEFLVACPTAIKEVTIREETAVHLAVSNRCFQAFKVLMGWLYRTGNKRILDWKDKDGSTVLHIAAESGQVEVVKTLTREGVDPHIRNRDDKTALDIVEDRIAYVVSGATPISSETSSQNHSTLSEYVNIQKILHKVGAMKTSDLPRGFKMVDVLQRIPRYFERSDFIQQQAARDVDSHKGLTEDLRNAYLVVTILFVTASFQAVLSPPGGGWERNDNDNDNNSNITSLVMPPNTTMKYSESSVQKGSFPSRRGPKELLFNPFIILNSITFCASVSQTLVLLPFFYAENTRLITMSLMCLIATYLMSVWLISPPNGNSISVVMASIMGLHVCFVHIKLIPESLAETNWIPIPRLRKFIRRRYAKDVYHYRMEKRVRHGKYNSKPSDLRS